MRLASIRIENLRSFCDETIPVDPYTCLVGANGSGKSTILTALNIFFRDNANSATDLLRLEREDFHAGNTANPVKVTLTFLDLSPEAQKDFAAYYRHDKLVISAEAKWNEATQCAEVKQIGERMGIEAFGEFYDAVAAKKKKPELEAIFTKLSKQYGIVAKYGSQAAAETTLRDYEAKNPEKCKTIPSPTEFYGYTGGEYLLNKYVQWIYVPAVKDASEEAAEGKDTCLTKLVERVAKGKLTFDQDLSALRQKIQAEYSLIIDKNQVHLDGLSRSLGARLREWAHPDTRMQVSFAPNDKAVQIAKPPARIKAGEGIFDGAISRFGHGLQRCLLLAILQELAATDTPDGPRLLLGIEEPELYQHPPQARHMASVLRQLPDKNSQIIVSTHSPYFVCGQHIEEIRLIQKRPGRQDSTVAHVEVQQLSRALAEAWDHSQPDAPGATKAKVNQILQASLNEMFFAPVIILVEGLEDVAYISSYLAITGQIAEFRSLGCHLIPVNGKDSLVQPIVIARLLNIPVFVVFDSDADAKNAVHRAQHARDNAAILRAMDYDKVDHMPIETLWKHNLVMWRSEIGKVVSEDVGMEACRALRESVRNKHRLHGRGNLNKNTMLIGYVLAEAADRGMKSPMLARLVESILAFARQSRGKTDAERDAVQPAADVAEPAEKPESVGAGAH